MEPALRGPVRGTHPVMWGRCATMRDTGIRPALGGVRPSTRPQLERESARSSRAGLGKSNGWSGPSGRLALGDRGQVKVSTTCADTEDVTISVFGGSLLDTGCRGSRRFLWRRPSRAITDLFSSGPGELADN